MRLIDADALLPMMKYATTDSEIGVFPIKIGFNAIAKVIEDAPTIDAVTVADIIEVEKERNYWHDLADSYERTILKLNNALQESVPVRHNSDCISRQAAIDALYDWSEHSMTDAEAWHIKQVIGDIKSLPSAQSDLEAKILAAGYTGKEVRIYIGGRLFGVRELAQ